MRTPIALTLALCASALRLGAQSERLPVARTGDPVVLTTSARKVIRGDLMGVVGDTVFVSRARGGVTPVLRRDVTRTQVQGPPSRRGGAGRGARVGAVAGLLLGIWAAAQGSECTSGGEEVECPAQLKSSGGEGVFAVMLAIGAGALAGSVVGSAFPTTGWRDAELPEPAAGDAEPSFQCGVPAMRPVAFSPRAAIGGRRC